MCIHATCDQRHSYSSTWAVTRIVPWTFSQGFGNSRSVPNCIFLADDSFHDSTFNPMFRMLPNDLSHPTTFFKLAVEPTSSLFEFTVSRLLLDYAPRVLLFSPSFVTEAIDMPLFEVVPSSTVRQSPRFLSLAPRFLSSSSFGRTSSSIAVPSSSLS
jgi:hypothetical protein